MLCTQEVYDIGLTEVPKLRGNGGMEGSVIIDVMDHFRPLVAFTVLAAVVALLLPPGVVCAAVTGPSSSACPMAALMEMASPPCEGGAIHGAERCCCSMGERPPVPLPTVPEMASFGSPELSLLPASGPATLAVSAPPRTQCPLAMDRDLPPPAPIDLFLRHSTYLI